MKDVKKLDAIRKKQFSHSARASYELLQKLNSPSYTPFLSCWTVHHKVSHTLLTGVHLYPFLSRMQALNRYSRVIKGAEPCEKEGMESEKFFSESDQCVSEE